MIDKKAERWILDKEKERDRKGVKKIVRWSKKRRQIN